MPAMNPLPSLIRASAWDAGCASMRRACRTKWNDDDWNAAAETQERLVRACYGDAGDNHPDLCFIRFGAAEQLERAGRLTLSDDIRAALAAAGVN